MTMKSIFAKALSLVLLLAIVGLCPHSAVSREIVATNEWQLLGENDTIPAGLHVRMDMTTGEKWVKLDNDDDDGGSSGGGDKATSGKTAHDTSSSSVAIVQADGSIVSAQDDEQPKDDEPDYDYEMMYRTLSKLPEDEKERFGGIPDIIPKSSSTVDSLSPEARKIFEERMASIWEQRQRELKALEDSVVDMPELLKQRIQSIQDYLSDPTTQLVEMAEGVGGGDSKSESKINDDADDDENGNYILTDIISVLEDLEFQLTDVDMARDFHTLGGWRLLVSLMSDGVHMSKNLTDATIESIETSDAYSIQKSKVQRYAAWAVGTTVKNSGEFTPYALEPTTRTHGGLNAIDLATNLLCRGQDHDGNEYRHLDEGSDRQLREKAIYALGSLLRGNHLGQAYFCSSTNDNKSKLQRYLKGIVELPMTTDQRKLTQRLLALASDVISDVELNPPPSQQEQGGQPNGDRIDDEDEKIARSTILQCFSTDAWCDFISHTLLHSSTTESQPKLQQTVLETAGVVGPRCGSWRDEDNSQKMVETIQNIQNRWDEESFDPDHYEELMEAAKGALAVVQ